MDNAIVFLNDDKPKLLQGKHPKAKPACEEITMTRDLPVIHPASFEERELIKRA